MLSEKGDSPSARGAANSRLGLEDFSHSPIRKFSPPVTLCPSSSVQCLMRLALLPTFLIPTSLRQTAVYLPGIQQRCDASDLVCIGKATILFRTGS